jgi:murein DD-endopeptidase MepM/ murein hydrolase activator NlpD
MAVSDIVDANKLSEPTLAIGPTLVIPGVSGGPLPVTSGGMRWPVLGNSWITQYFWSGHPALDIAAPYGSPIVAAAAGTVIYAGWKTTGGGVGGGIVVWISHGSGVYTTYNHLSKEIVKVGQRVRAGQRVGSLGATGDATGPHLHFEVWVCYPWTGWTTSCARNPLKYVG